MARHALLHALFHSVASLGYIPFALTSTLIAISTPYIDLSPIAVILLAFTPPLTLFPLLCFSYRYLEKFTSISLTIQRAKTYIILAGCGLCLLVSTQLLLVHLVASPRNSRYNTLIHTTVPTTQTQDFPNISPSNPQQVKPQQHIQQPQHVLPSNGWLIPGTGSADASPLQSALLIESLTSKHDQGHAQQGASPSSADEETSRTLLHESIGVDSRPVLSDIAMISPRHLRRRRRHHLTRRVDRVTAEEEDILTRKTTPIEGRQDEEENDMSAPGSTSAQVDDPATWQKDTSVPIMAPIPTYLLPESPGPSLDDLSTQLQPLSLLTDDLGGPIVPNVSGTTLEESGEIVDPSTVIEGAHSQSDQAELRPLDIIAPVILLGVTQDFDASSAAVPNEAEEATLPWKPEESKSELALPLPLSTLSADIYAQRGDGESERSGSAQSNKNDDDPSQGLQPCPHSPTEWDEDLTELRSSSSGPTSGRPSTGFYTVAGFVTVLFVASQAALIGLLTMLFLGVLILTEFVLDREDESPDASRRCRLYWARGVGISIATIASAIHGSMLSTYVLLDGQSDWISKAVIASIAFYWPAMIVLMKHISVPPPWEC